MTPGEGKCWESVQPSVLQRTMLQELIRVNKLRVGRQVTEVIVVIFVYFLVSEGTQLSK